MHILLRSAITLSLALPLSPALALPQPLKLAPSSKWHVDYAAEHCRLAREFGPEFTARGWRRHLPRQ